MQHLEHVLAERDRLALVEEAVRHAVAHGVADAEPLGLVLDIVEQRLVRLVRADDLDAERFLQLHRAAGMVDMAMRQPDRRRLDAVLLQRGEDLVDVAAGIDDHAGLVVHVEQDRAVLLERRDRHDAGIELTHMCRLVCRVGSHIEAACRRVHPCAAARIEAVQSVSSASTGTKSECFSRLRATLLRNSRMTSFSSIMRRVKRS